MYFRLMDDVTFAQNGSGDAEMAYTQTDSTEGSMYLIIIIIIIIIIIASQR